MKKLILSLILIYAVVIPSNIVFAGRSQVELSLNDAYYEMTSGSVKGLDTPTLDVKITGDSVTAFAFRLVLDGAEWDATKMSKFDSELTVSRTSSKDIQLKFSKEFFKKYKTGNTTEFSIPLYAKNFTDGYTYLYITETPTYMDEDSFLFACNIAGGFSAIYDEKALIYKTGVSVLSDFTISDSTNYAAVPDEMTFRINISDPNFAITGVPEIVGTGKYEDNVYGELESASVLNIKVKETSDMGTGLITVKGLTLNRSATKITAAPNITLNASRTVTFETNEGTTKTRKVESRSTFSCGVYQDAKSSLSAETVSEAEAEEEAEADEAETETYEEENEGGNILTFTVGDEGYVLNGERAEITSPCIVSDGRTLLPLRALSTALGVSDDEIIYDAETKTVVIIKNGNRISVEQNGDYMYVNGRQIEVTTPAIVYNSSMYLPVRDICNALGISDEDIDYDTETKTVTIVF
ncbi:MAG: copper amine oxidase N-terminal domain-containing protein [Clostridiales bacterium]|nr:copper amine oxidase N-terminal domain-containing protein [Clostridiales bacterium]